MLLVALGVRLAHLQQVIRHDPFFFRPVVDARAHDLWARDIAAGRAPSTTVFFKPPLYPYLLAAVYRLSDGSYIAPRVLQALLGALACTAVSLLALVVFGDPAVSAVAGLAAAVYGPLVSMDSQLLAEGVAVLLCLVFLLAAVRAQRRQTPSAWAVAGLALAVATLARPPVVLGGLLIGAWAAWRAYTTEGARGLMRTAGPYALGVVMGIMPVAARNWYVGRELTPVCANAGINFYIGNGPAATGLTSVNTGARWESLQRLPREHGVERPGAASAFWFRRGLAFVAANPGHAAKLLARKLLALWSPYEVRNNVSYALLRGYSWVTRVPLLHFGIVGPLGLVGAIWALRRREGEGSVLLVLFAATYMMALLPFFVCGRYRLPAVPVLVIFAAYLAVHAARCLLRRQWRQAIIPLLIATAAGGGFYLDPSGSAEWARVTPRDHFLLAEALRGTTADPEQALRHLREAAADPTDADPHLLLGLHFEGRGRTDEARREYEMALAVQPDFFDALNNLGGLLVRQGTPDQGLRFLARAAVLEPDRPRVWANLALCYMLLNRESEALAAARRARHLVPDGHPAITAIVRLVEATEGRSSPNGGRLEALSPVTKGSLADLLISQGRHAEALQLAESAAEDSPDDPTARLRLGAACEWAGELERAAAVYRDVHERFPDTPDATLASERLTAMAGD